MQVRLRLMVWLGRESAHILKRAKAIDGEDSGEFTQRTQARMIEVSHLQMQEMQISSAGLGGESGEIELQASAKRTTRTWNKRKILWLIRHRFLCKRKGQGIVEEFS